MDPCGTPHVIIIGFDLLLFAIVIWVLSVKQFCISLAGNPRNT